MNIVSTSSLTHRALPINGLDHVGIRVSDLASAAEFYTGLLGFQYAFELPRIDDPGRVGIVYYKVSDDQFIELYPEPLDDEDRRISHFSLRTHNADELRRLVTEIGLQPTPMFTGRDGNKHFDLRDPDGHRIEVSDIQPGSMHARSRGQHLGPDRISTHLRHVAFGTADLAASLEFYVGKLGMTIYNEAYDRGMLRVFVRITGAEDEFIQLTEIPANWSAKDIRRMEHICMDASGASESRNGLADRLTYADPDDTRIERALPEVLK